VMGSRQCSGVRAALVRGSLASCIQSFSGGCSGRLGPRTASDTLGRTGHDGRLTEEGRHVLTGSDMTHVCHFNVQWLPQRGNCAVPASCHSKDLAILGRKGWCCWGRCLGVTVVCSPVCPRVTMGAAWALGTPLPAGAGHSFVAAADFALDSLTHFSISFTKGGER
jgi:hypothetical protein